MKESETIIRKIANTLYVNIQNIEGNGLLDGKLGIALFFYHYSRYTGFEKYTEFPDILLDNIYGDVSRQSPKDFSSGLSGIGWAIDHLVKNEFVETGGDDILSDVDDFIREVTLEECIAEIDSEIPLFSKGLYFIQRGKNDLIVETLLQLKELIFNHGGVLPLSYINSVIYFLLSCKDLKIEDNVCVEILKKLTPIIDKTFEEGLFEKGDITYLQENLKKVLSIDKISNAYEPFINLCEQNYSREIKDRMNYLYQTVPNQYSDLSEVDNFIEDSLLTLDPSKLTALKGLSGIGLSLLINK